MFGNSVGLGCLLAKGETNDEIDIRRADMRSRPLRELSDQVSRGKTACQVDALSPRPEIAEQGE